MNYKKRILMFILCLALVFTMEGGRLLSLFAVTAEAVENTYSNVLDDLQNDPSFNPDHYPAIPGDSDIKLIHIGEGSDGELFIYTYQPGNETYHYEAKYINMSLQHATDKNPVHRLYSLTWVNSDGVFDKYLVNDFSVSGDVYRYYNISSIYRLYDETVDASSSSESIDSIQCKAFKVAQVWCLYYYNNTLIYEMENIEVVEYTDWATGSIRYTEGFKFYVDSCDSHYIAFSIDNFNVEKIYDADITYTINKYSKASGLGLSGEIELEGTETISKTLTEFDTGSNKGDGLLGVKYTWDRISSVPQFIEEVHNDTNDNFSAEELTGLNKADFVFRFAETSYSITSSTYTTVSFWSEVIEIGILRMHFLSEGKVYNLGCVGDFVGIDSEPELEVTIEDNIQNNPLLILIVIILLVILLLNLIGPIKALLDILFSSLKFIASLTFAILQLPLRLLGLGRKKR